MGPFVIVFTIIILHMVAFLGGVMAHSYCISDSGIGLHPAFAALLGWAAGLSGGLLFAMIPQSWITWEKEVK